MVPAALCVLRSETNFLTRLLGGRDGDGRVEPPFLSPCPGLQVSPNDGEGSGKHLYLKSTLSTVPLSERSRQAVVVGRWGEEGGVGGEQVALSTHADTEGASSTHSSAVSLELFMVIVLSAFLSIPWEAGAQGG